MRRRRLGLLAVCILVFLALAVTAFLVESDEEERPQIRAAGETALGPVTYRRQVKSSPDSGSQQTLQGSKQPGAEPDSGNAAEEETAPAPEESPPPEEAPPDVPEEPPSSEEAPSEKPPEQR